MIPNRRSFNPESTLYTRFVEQHVRDVLADTPVALVVGPRRAGKTTLAQALSLADRAYLTLDDQTVLASARADPAALVRGLDKATIDEVQRVPELLLAIKRSVDDDYRPGRFLLTGSANVLTLPRIADSLAGRMETIRMMPLSHAEIVGRRPSFLETVMAGELPSAGDPVIGDARVEIGLAGGYPEAIARGNERRRQDWIRSYLDSVLTRDLRDIAEIEKLTELPKFVRLLAEHSGQLVNYSAIGGGIDVTHKTSQRYVGLLEQLFLVATIRPWHTNAVKRAIKTPKVHFLDSGVLAALRSLNLARAKSDRTAFGAVLETFVFAEIIKLMTWSEMRITPHHFRDQDMREVDIVLERDDGLIAGLEVKASASVAAKDFSGLRKLSEAAKRKFVLGVVLYDGDTVVPFGDKLAAVPISCLWS